MMTDEMSNIYNEYCDQEKAYKDQFLIYYELQEPAFIHPDPEQPRGDQQVVLDKALFQCRYCGRAKDDGAMFKKAHVIPEMLGNKLIVSDAECTLCNEVFSIYETHLSELLGPLKTILGVEGKSRRGRRIPKFKDPVVGTAITRSSEGVSWLLDPQRTIVRFDTSSDFIVGTRLLPFKHLLAWKGLARSAIHMLELGELDEFSWFRLAVSSEKKDQELTNSIGITSVLSTYFPSMHNVFPLPELRLFKRKTENIHSVTEMILPAKMFILIAASHVFQIPVFTDEDIKCITGSDSGSSSLANPRNLPIFPVEVTKEFVNEYGLPSRSQLNLHSLEDVEMINFIPIRHPSMQALNDEKFRELGLSEEGLRRLKSIGLEGEEAVRIVLQILRQFDQDL